MSHSHEYSFWHTHPHEHRDESKGIGGWEPETNDYYTFEHDTGHYHLWTQTHDHGDGIRPPHTHKDRQVHPDESFVHHHAPVDHKPLDDVDEHHPECKPPYYGGGLKGCISRCGAKKKKSEPCGDICFHTCGERTKV